MTVERGRGIVSVGVVREYIGAITVYVNWLASVNEFPRDGVYGECYGA